MSENPIARSVLRPAVAALLLAALPLLALTAALAVPSARLGHREPD